MSARTYPDSMDITEAAVVLEPVTVDSASILHNLFELYAYDFSEHMPIQIKASGRFELTPGDVWWTRDDHFAYLIKLRGELAGFALVRAGSRVTNASDVMDVAEFFVLRGIRGKGIGRSAAHALFRTFPGAWEVRVRRTNVAAMQFWSRVAGSWVGQPVASSPFSIEGTDWDLLRFVTGG
jgi:predicted acetyltransferase